MSIKPIQTFYKGCHFRSRLEARWAKFFDAAGIAWEYEPQGFEVSWRLEGGYGADGGETFRYLPDFWLPDLGVWGEVKGELDSPETVRLLNAAASLSSNDGGGCHDAGGHDLAVFGPLTASATIGSPVRLHMHKGDLLATCLWCADPHGFGTKKYVVLADDCNGAPLNGGDRGLLRGFGCATHGLEHVSAYRKARSARFEFGASR